MINISPAPLGVDYAVLPDGMPDAFELDSFLSSDEPAFRALCGVVADIAAEHGRWERVTAPRRKLVGLLIANLFVAHCRAPLKAVKYYRTPKAYIGRSAYRSGDLSARPLCSVIDALTSAGLVGSEAGRKGPQGVGSMLSLVWAKPQMIELFERFGMGRAMFQASGDAPTVFLRAKKRGTRGDLVEYGDYPKVVALARPIGAYNTFIAGVPLELPVKYRQLRTGAPTFVDHQPLDIEPRWIDLHDRRLRRVFNNVDEEAINLDQGGRYYGGWWQSVESDHRAFITIDGEPTVELDFASMHPRMLYHKEGLELPGDAYRVPALVDACRDMNPAVARKTCKRLFAALINCSRRKTSAALRGPQAEVLANWGCELPPDLRLGEAWTMIEEHHTPIRRHFRSGVGVRLQFLDSEICARVLHASSFGGIPVLPVHDSFICRRRDENWLRAQMNSAYRMMMGDFRPQIERKGIAGNG